MTRTMKVVPAAEPVKTGVKNARTVAEGLIEALADTYRLVYKTHAIHWNVEGPLFFSVHNLTEAQYQDLFKAADEIAERARALGQLAPMRLEEIIDLSQVEDAAKPLSAEEMVAELARDHEAVAKRMHALSEMAEEHKDPVTADLLTGRSAFHEKVAWMLRATAKTA